MEVILFHVNLSLHTLVFLSKRLDTVQTGTEGGDDFKLNHK